MKTFPLYLLVFASLLFVTSCVDDDDPMDPAVELNVPDTYEFTRAGASTVSFSGQTTRIGMAEEMATALLEPGTSLETLNNMFRNPEGVDPFTSVDLNASSKSIRSKVAAGAAIYGQDAVRAAEIREDFDGWLASQVNDVFPAWNELAAPGQPGQIAEGSIPRYINGWGLEYDQAFTKSLISALMIDQINNHYLTAQVLDGGNFRADNDNGTTAADQPYTDMEHRWDEAFGYVFGASASPATPLVDLLTADSYLNKYLGRINNDEDYAGIAEEIEEAFRTGRQAIVQRAYEERDAEAKKIQDRLEDVIAIRAIYYLKQGEANLRSTPAALGAAFHDLSEGYGFIYGLRFLPSGDGGIDWYEESDNLLATLRNADGSGWWDINPDVLATLADDIASMTGISVEEAGE